MADPASVPAGRYGQAALERLGVWARVAPQVVRAENVRAALALVERGAAPLGIVYATDARASPGGARRGGVPGGEPPADPLSDRAAEGVAQPRGGGVPRASCCRAEGQAIFARLRLHAALETVA